MPSLSQAIQVLFSRRGVSFHLLASTPTVLVLVGWGGNGVLVVFVVLAMMIVVVLHYHITMVYHMQHGIYCEHLAIWDYSNSNL